MALRRSFKSFATRINSFGKRVVHKGKHNKDDRGSEQLPEPAIIVYDLPEIDAGPELPDLSSCEIEEETLELCQPTASLSPCSEPLSPPETDILSEESASQITSKTFSSITTSRTTASAFNSAAELVEKAPPNEQEECYVNTPDLDNLRVFINTLPFPTTYTPSACLTIESREANYKHPSYDNTSREEIFADIVGAVNKNDLQVVALAIRRSRHRKSHQFVRLPQNLTCTCSPETVHGTYNVLIRLEFSDGVKWLARFPSRGLDMTELDQKEMDNEFRTMRFVRDNCSIPIPEVYYWSTKQTPSVGPPFALMECLPGCALDEIWDKLDEPSQLKALDEIAKAMVQLTKTRFSQIGTLRFDEKQSFAGIGPMVNFTDAKFLSTNQHEIGPFYNLERRLINSMNLDEHSWSECDKRIAMLAINSVPDFMLDPSKITMCHPDLNSQNIMINHNGQITGFVDWERASTSLMSTGCARYPIWIMDDFDPYRYEYDLERVDEIDEVLVDFRKYYAESFARHAEAQGLKDHDPRITEVSHLLYAINIMVDRQKERPFVRDQLLDYAFGGDWRFSMEDYMKTLKNGMNEKYDGIIIDAFSKMWKPEWEMPWWEAAGIEARGDAEEGYTFSRENAEAAELTFSKVSSRSSRVKSRVRGSWRSFKQSLTPKLGSRKRSSKRRTGAVLGLNEMKQQQSAWLCGHAPIAKDQAYV